MDVDHGLAFEPVIILIEVYQNKKIPAELVGGVGGRREVPMSNEEVNFKDVGGGGAYVGETFALFDGSEEE